MPSLHKKKVKEFKPHVTPKKVICTHFTNELGEKVQDEHCKFFTIGKSYYYYNHMVKDDHSHERRIGRLSDPLKTRCYEVGTSKRFAHFSV